MSIYLVQHGLCVSKEENPERPLSKDGAEQVKAVAARLKKSGITVKCIEHSGKARAKETAEIFAPMICPEGEVVPSAGLAPLDSVAIFAGRLDPESGRMYVGHLPFMEKLVSFLISGNEDKNVLKFHNGGVVCLEMEKNNWRIKWMVIPEFCG